MSERWLTRTAWVVALVAGVTLVVAQALLVVRGVSPRGDPVPTGWVAATVVLLFGTFLVVGGVLAARQARHPVGWLLLATGVAGATLSMGSLIHGIAEDPALRSLGAWLDAGLWHPSFPALGLLFLLFPTGAPPTPRWRWLQYLLIGSWTALVATAPFTTPGLMLEFYPDAQPLVAGPWSSVLELPHDVVQMAVIFAMLPLAVASMVVRAVRSSGLERQQLKWFAASAVVVAVGFTLSLSVVGNGSVGILFFALLPISCAIAVLRYHLYDLGRIIRRGLVYGVLTAALLAVYGAGTLILGQLLGQAAPGSSLPVAATTLLVAALFRPLRRRIQRVFDRAFYRSRYDAQAEVARFAAGVRSLTELDALRHELIEVVDGTLQPAGTALWLRDLSAGGRS